MSHPAKKRSPRPAPARALEQQVGAILERQAPKEWSGLALMRAGSLDAEARTLKARVSTRDVDGHGTIILPSAFQTARYEANPVMLLAHDRWDLPIGRCMGLSRDADGMDATFKFADTKRANKVFSLYQQDMMRGFSVCGRIQEAYWSWQHPDKWSADLPDYARKALENRTCDGVITRLELHEISACSIPSNAAALARSSDSGLLELMERISVRLDQLFERLDRKADPDEDPDEDEDTDQDDDTAEAAAPAPVHEDAHEVGKRMADLGRLLAVAVARRDSKEAQRLTDAIYSLAS